MHYSNFEEWSSTELFKTLNPGPIRSVRMPAGEFQRIMKDLSSIGDTVIVSVTKDGVKFSTSGDIGSANVTVRQNTSVDKPVCSAVPVSPCAQRPCYVSQHCAVPPDLR